MCGKKKVIFFGESVLKLNNFGRIEYFWFEIISWLLFCNLIVLWFLWFDCLESEFIVMLDWFIGFF